ncbi:DNA polymerase I [Nakamurella endophytica]|nr:DNA polymerase I [Nakamurella endophytica]
MATSTATARRSTRSGTRSAAGRSAPAAAAAPAGERPPRLLLLDGHSLAYRAFFALPVEKFATTTGQPTNAVYGFTSMLINLLRDETPTHVAVAFDVSRQTWRAEEYPEYKANRSSSPTDFRGQVELVKEVLAALRIPVLTADNFEADDVIATLTVRAAAEGMQVLICTGDRDALQLVTDQVTVLYPRKGVSDMTRFTPEEVAERYGLTPAQYPDFAALRGDPSDNLPNIPGVGEKTAAKWIRDFGSLTALVDRVDEVPGKAGDALRAALSSVLQNRRLTELVRDVDVPADPVVDLRMAPYDREAVHRIFDNLQFKVLRERLLETFEQADETSTEGFEVTGDRLRTGQVGGWLAEHAAAGATGLHLAGAWAPGGGDVRRVALATADGEAAVLETTDLDQDDDAALAAWLADADRPKVGHDLKPAINALVARGWTLGGLTSDTALAAYLALPGQRAFDLGDLVQRYLHRTLDAGQAEGGADQLELAFETDDPAQAEHAADQADMIQARAVIDLAEALDQQLVASGQHDLLTDLELPVMQVLGRMERTGIAVDAAYLADLHATFSTEADTAAQAAYAEIGKEVNLGSPKQLQVVLFDELGMPKTKRTKTGYTTDADSLAALYEQTEHPFLAHLLRHRDVTKLRTTVEGLQKAVGADGRIHTTYLQTVAATGRLSSTEPNLQNIPVRTDEGRLIRRAFVPGDGFESLITADYSQIEMRIMAHLSGDEGLIEAFRSGEDLHTFVAMRAFGLPAEQVTGEMRRRIKAMSYGLAYGLSAFGLSGQLKISVDEARQQMEAYFARFGGIRDYLRRTVDVARQEGYTQTLLGRRRYLPDLTSDNRQRRELAERAALNAPIQGSAADIIKVAMLRVQRRLDREGLRSQLLLQVHDELVCEVGPGEQEALTTVLREEMGGAYPLTVDMDVSVGVGRSWDDAAH